MTRRVQFGSAGRRGFSFTEILFAVMILGIGFIMIAAMFPVAIHQTEASNRETIAASLGRAGAECLSKVALIQYNVTPTTTKSILIQTFSGTPGMPTLSLNPPVSTAELPGQVWSMYDTAHVAPVFARTMWDSVAKNLIQQIDPRFGWIAMYRRDYIVQGTPGLPADPNTLTPAPFAQVIIIGVQSRNNPTYYNATGNGALTDTPMTPVPGMLLPQYFQGAVLSPPTNGNPFSTILFKNVPNGQMVAEGSYVIVSDDGAKGLYNGRVYKIGVQDPSSSNLWQFLPGEGMSMNDAPLSSANVFVVGPGCDCNNTTVRGPSEAISAYSTYIPVPN